VAGRRGGGDRHAVAVEELDGGAVDAGLTRVLHAGAVGVEPQTVADRAGAVIAEVDVGAVGTGRERQRGDVGRRDAVEVEGRSQTGRQRARDDADRVVAAGQVQERVVAVAAGGRGGDDGVAGVEQLHGDAVDTGLTG